MSPARNDRGGRYPEAFFVTLGNHAALQRCATNSNLPFCRVNPIRVLSKKQKEMTLDRRLATVQPRVISVRSYYLASALDLSFYGFCFRRLPYLILRSFRLSF